MRLSRKGRVAAALVGVLLLLAAALAAGTWLQEPEPVPEAKPLAERYVPCPAGTKARPAQPHICVPD